jgi:hypothetical protein
MFKTLFCLNEGWNNAVKNCGARGLTASTVAAEIPQLQSY